MKIVFAGTPQFSVAALQSILASRHEVVAVYCQPDRPSGRGRQLKPGPVKACALAHQIPVYQPVSLRDHQEQQFFSQLGADIMVVVAYGLILPLEILQAPRLGCLNIHASLLPRWRGAAPIQRAILAGDVSSGITIMQMDEGLDTGDMLLKSELTIGKHENADSLHDRLMQLGAESIIEAIDQIESGKSQAIPQTDIDACYAHKLEKSEAIIDWTGSSIQIERQVRAFNSWPVAQTIWKDKVLRIWDAVARDDVVDDVPAGTVLKASKDGIDIKCNSGMLRVSQLQLPGGKPMTAQAFLNAHKIAGDRLG